MVDAAHPRSFRRALREAPSSPGGFAIIVLTGALALVVTYAFKQEWDSSKAVMPIGAALLAWAVRAFIRWRDQPLDENRRLQRELRETRRATRRANTTSQTPAAPAVDELAPADAPVSTTAAPRTTSPPLLDPPAADVLPSTADDFQWLERSRNCHQNYQVNLAKLCRDPRQRPSPGERPAVDSATLERMRKCALWSHVRLHLWRIRGQFLECKVERKRPYIARRFLAVYAYGADWIAANFGESARSDFVRAVELNRRKGKDRIGPYHGGEDDPDFKCDVYAKFIEDFRGGMDFGEPDRLRDRCDPNFYSMPNFDP